MELDLRWSAWSFGASSVHSDADQQTLIASRKFIAQFIGDKSFVDYFECEGLLKSTFRIGVHCVP